MPVDKRKVTVKTLLVAVAVPLLVFGVELFVDGQTVQGGAALVFGVAAAGVFVAFQEYDVPSEREIRALVESANITTEDVTGLTEEISRQVDESGRGGDAG